MSTRPTIKDVARTAGVSVATVSRVLNGRRSVDPALSTKVLNAASELNFKASRLARSFRKRSAQTIALVVPDIQNPFFAAIAHEIEEAAFRSGYTLLICNTSDDLARETQYFDLLADEAVAGVIVSTANEHRVHDEIERAIVRGVAIVAIDRRLEGVPVDSVLSDNFGGARQATAHLIGLGHRRIAIVTGPDDFAPARERRLGFEQALRDHGLMPDPALVMATNFRDSGAEAAAHELWALAGRPTAIFVGSGNQAIGVLRALNTVGARIPDDISVMVFDDLEWASAFHPPITAIEQNTAQIGATAMTLLMNRIANPGANPEERRIPTRFHIRRSCAAPTLGQARKKRERAVPPMPGGKSAQNHRLKNGEGAN
jgi:LacI family transcriptional regulator